MTPVETNGIYTRGAPRTDRTRTFVGMYSFARDGGAAGAIALKDERNQPVVLPNNFVVEAVTVETVTALSEVSGTPTVAIGTAQSGQAAAFLAATNFNASPFAANDTVAAATASARHKVNEAAGAALQATIAAADLDAGVFYVVVRGYQGS